MMDLTDSELLAAACAALGVDFSTLPRSLREPTSQVANALPPAIPLALSDEEWGILVEHLPAEPAQADALGNRAFVDAVLWTVIKGKSWTHLGQISHEAVRRKFGRWANDGIWQHLYEAVVVQSELCPERLAQLQRIAERAERLRKKAVARRSRS